MGGSAGLSDGITSIQPRLNLWTFTVPLLFQSRAYLCIVFRLTHKFYLQKRCEPGHSLAGRPSSPHPSWTWLSGSLTVVIAAYLVKCLRVQPNF